MHKRYKTNKKQTQMFRKLVSNLPFSPALIHDVGFYAQRLRGEEVTRRLTLLFVVLALVMQSLAVFSAPESANASSEQDIVRGGVSNLDDFLLRFDRNDDDLKDILSTVGITRSELAAMKEGSIHSTNDTYILTRYGQLSASTNEASLSYQRSVGGMGVRYFTLLGQMSNRPVSFDGWIGNSSTVGWFAIIKSNGSLATHGLPASISPDDTSSTAVKSVSAANLTQGFANAANGLASPLDKIAYTLKVHNPGKTSITTTFSVQVSDLLEYSSLVDAGGATLDSETNTLSWPQVQLAPGESQERTFVMQLLAQLPATPDGNSNPASYDCRIAISFGTNLQVPVDCPPIKGVENIINQLPTTGIVANVIFAAVLLSVVVYFYFRTRQLKNEIRIIRHDLNAGII